MSKSKSRVADLHITVDAMLNDLSLRYGCSAFFSGTPALTNLERSGRLVNAGVPRQIGLSSEFELAHNSELKLI